MQLVKELHRIHTAVCGADVCLQHLQMPWLRPFWNVGLRKHCFHCSVFPSQASGCVRRQSWWWANNAVISFTAGAAAEESGI